MLMNLGLGFNKVKVNTLDKYLTCLAMRNRRHKTSFKVNIFSFVQLIACFFFFFFNLDLQLLMSVGEEKKRSSALESILNQTFLKIGILTNFDISGFYECFSFVLSPIDILFHNNHKCVAEAR